MTIYNEGLAKIAEQYLRKGSTVYLEGQLETRKWQDQSGADRYSTEINVGMNGVLTMLDGPPKGGDGSQGAPLEQARQHFPAAEQLDDDIPFFRTDTAW